VALVARYHRRSTPKVSHVPYQSLARDQRIEVVKLAAILRVGDVLDRAHLKNRRKIKVEKVPGVVRIVVGAFSDLNLEKQGVLDKADLFRQVYGMKVDIYG